MSAQTRQRVSKAIEELDFVPTFNGSLKHPVANLIGLLLPRIGNPIFAPLIEGVYEAAGRHGKFVMVMELSHANHLEDSKRLLGQGGLAGVIARPLRDENDEFIKLAERRNIPVVSLRSDGVDTSDDPTVINIADREAAALATRTLIRAGHRRIGYLGGNPQSDSTSSRLSGFLSELGSANIEQRPEWILHRDYTPETGYMLSRTLLEMEYRPSAVVVDNVLVALGVLATGYEKGLKVPSRLSVVGIHDVDSIAAYTTPALTTVRLPMHHYGRLAADRIITGAAEDLSTPVDESADPTSGEVVVVHRSSVAEPDDTHSR